ncbi:MAG TPA: ABC transporter substrate-binding protein, partial [Chloroflexota bacterium]|nr:ABC transporter substrate-binding protein [Chloroflexota bacterium]
NQSKWFATVDTPDKYTVVLKSDVSRPAAFDYFNALMIVDQESLSGPDAKTKEIGTGPFVFKEWVQGDHLTYAKNPNYWKSGRPYLDGYVASVTKDTAAMALRLESGAVDAINAPVLSDFVRYSKDPKYAALIPAGQQSALGLGANTLFPPTDNKLVRQALNYAIDRDRYASTVMQGVVKSSSLPWDPNSPAYEAAKDQTYTFNLDKAKSLLQQSGVTSAELDFLPSPNYPEFDLFGQIYQADLAKIGIKLNIVKLDNAAWLDQANNRKYHGLWASTISVPLGDPVTAFANGRGTDPNSNNEGYKNDKYAALIAQGASETDPAKRKMIYSQLNDIILDDAFIMSLSPYPPRLVTTAKVHDIVSSAWPGFNYYNAWMES